jgi:uncharacterized small protein (DUF1192 family)
LSVPGLEIRSFILQQVKIIKIKTELRRRSKAKNASEEYRYSISNGRGSPLRQDRVEVSNSGKPPIWALDWGLRVNFPAATIYSGFHERVFPTINYSITNMANIDSHVAKVLDTANSDDEDALIASLEDSPALDAFREQRIQQLHSEFTRAKAQKNQGFGNYTEIKEEKALMDLTTEVKYAVVHFAKDDFARCGVMDGHMEVS